MFPCRNVGEKNVKPMVTQYWKTKKVLSCCKNNVKDSGDLLPFMLGDHEVVMERSAILLHTIVSLMIPLHVKLLKSETCFLCWALDVLVNSMVDL